MVGVLGPLFCTAGHAVRTQHGITASAGKKRGDVELRSYQSLKSKVGLAAAKAEALRINLHVVGCGIVAAPVHAPSRGPLLLPLLLSHNLPLPRVH